MNCGMHDLDSLCNKRGKDWTAEDIKTVFNSLESEMLDKFVRFAYGFTNRFSPPLEREQAFDLAIEVVWDKIADALSYYRNSYNPVLYQGPKCPLLNWIYTMIARAAVRKAIQEAQRKKRDEEQEIDRQQQEILTQSYPPEPDVDWEQLWELAMPYIEQLSPKYQEAILLIKKEGLSHAEAARTSCWPCSVSAMKVRLCRALQELRDHMRKGGLLS